MNGAAPLRLGSRRSALARAQTEWVAQRLAAPTAFVWVSSAGDQDEGRPLTAFGSTGVFTAALHRALLEDRCDAAVHSLKDLPAGAEAGVTLACVPRREDPRDAWIVRGGESFEAIAPGARVGTGSPRRRAQLARARPDLEFVEVRGNVDTRLERLRAGAVDALVLALAGLRRLGRELEVTQVLDPALCLPAAGQGALGLTVREGDARTAARLEALGDVRAAAATTAERAALRALGAGCHAPLGALARAEGGRLTLRVRLLAPDGGAELVAEVEGGLAEAGALGEAAARDLLARGAGRWLTR